MRRSDLAAAWPPCLAQLRTLTLTVSLALALALSFAPLGARAAPAAPGADPEPPNAQARAVAALARARTIALAAAPPIYPVAPVTRIFIAFPLEKSPLFPDVSYRYPIQLKELKESSRSDGLKSAPRPVREGLGAPYEARCVRCEEQRNLLQSLPGERGGQQEPGSPDWPRGGLLMWHIVQSQA